MTPTANRRSPVQDLLQRDLRSGLTALELVSALALFVIVFGTLLIALESANDTWTRSSDKNRDLLKARNALDLLATDLACAVAPRRAADREADTSTTLGASQKPIFIAERAEKQIGLYFVTFHPTTARSPQAPLSLDLVAYSWTTNGLSRYVTGVEAENNRTDAPDLCSQLENFKTKVAAIQTPSNILASTISSFAFLFYQPTKMTATGSSIAPHYIGYDDDNIAANIRLADLPDYADLFVAYINADDWAHGYTNSHALTRRVTLPAAQASRLP